MNKKTFFAISALSISISAQAQEAGVCNALLDHGIANSVSYSNEYDYSVAVFDKFCRSNFSNLSDESQVEFSAVVKAIPIGLKGSSDSTSTQHQNFCREFHFDERMRGSTTFEARRLMDQAISEWGRCVALELGGLQISSTPAPDQKSVSFAIRVGTGDGVLTGVDAQEMACEANGSAIGAKAQIELSANEVVVRCTRNHKEMTFEGSPVTFYPSANATLKTNRGNQAIHFPEMINGPAKTRFDSLSAELLSLRTQVQDLRKLILNAEAKTVAGSGGDIRHVSAPDCGEGWISTNAVFVNSYPGGPAGQGNRQRLCLRFGGGN